MPRLRRTIFAIGTAILMVTAFAAVMASSASAQATASAPAAAGTLAAPDTYYLGCTDNNGYSGAQEFWRCTGTSATSAWVGSSCAEGEYNAGTYYNVYDVYNKCHTRVWLHEYTYPYDVNNGWSVCIDPVNGTEYEIDSAYVHPENIMVSANTAAC